MVKRVRLSNSQRKELRKNEEQAFKELEENVQEYDVNTSKPSQFKELPLSEATLKGLIESNYISLTDIQREAIPYALKGKDILGAARTGSGKTLAFLIPVIEKLYRGRWTEFDGLGALILSPTRELAMQIYEVLIKIGKYSSLSAGLVIGGKDVKYEMERVSKINILIGTPGRVLQHLEEAVGLETSNLQVLVLDEADRILDMGFKKTVDSIISSLPPTRQTLLFSATQSNSITSLARLSLTNPKYIGVDEAEKQISTPETLSQSYITVELQDKLDVLFSFIKTHLKTKILVFFSSSKQVHFVYETFRKLQPGISLMKLHGRQKQTSRTETVYKFSKAKDVCLFATDVVARGLDFPTIEWVVQVDCPEDSDTYVHRVGRAARFGKAGKSLLMLTPSEEEGMIKRLQARKIEVNKLNIKQSKRRSIKSQLQALCFKDPELKYLAQRAFISYVRSIYIMKDKDIFKYEEIPSEEFAKSLGLPGAPKIKVKGGNRNKELKNAPRGLLALSKTNEDGEIEQSDDEDKKVRTKYDRMFERQNQSVLSDHYLKITNADTKDEDEDNEDDFIMVKRADHELKDEDLPILSEPTSKRSMKKALSKKKSLLDKGNPKKLVFDDEGNSHQIYEFEDEEDFRKAGDATTQKDEFVAKESQLMKDTDVVDKVLAKQKKLEKKRKRQEAERRALEQSDFSDDSQEEDRDDDENEADLDRDFQSNDSESHDEPATKKAKWFENEKVGGKHRSRDEVLELEVPETIEDLEALTSRLINS